MGYLCGKGIVFVTFCLSVDSYLNFKRHACTLQASIPKSTVAALNSLHGPLNLFRQSMEGTSELPTAHFSLSSSNPRDETRRDETRRDEFYGSFS